MYTVLLTDNERRLFIMQA